MQFRHVGQAFAVFLLFVVTCAPVRSQSGDLNVDIQWPNHGETVYGGRSSLLYMIPIKGEVTSDTYPLEDVDVTLEIFSGDVSLGTLHHDGQADGSFAFEVTVNPHASTEVFTIGFTDCGLLCHSEGEMALQPGPLLARVTATASDGESAVAERAFIVDIAATASVPVEVVLASDEDAKVAGVNVSAAAWIYMWRARFGAAQTDAFGHADVHVEALGQAPTRYIFRIEPTIVDGVLYEGRETVTVELPPGARDAPDIRLQVEPFRGHIHGQVAARDSTPLTVNAISLPEGRLTKVPATAEGSFTFNDLDVDQYLLVVSRRQAGEDTIQLAPDMRYVDLTQRLTETVRLNFGEPLQRAQGALVDEDGRSLPFGWLSGDDASIGVLPRDGRFFIPPEISRSNYLAVHAPGHYALMASLALWNGGEGETITLRRQPGTQLLPWGDGNVVAPAENMQEVNNGIVTLQRGYLWGQGHGDRAFTIDVPSARIVLSNARFALQALPEEHSWLYVFQGEARVIGSGQSDAVLVREGQMVNLLNHEGLSPVPYDSLVIAALGSHHISTVPPQWEPSLGAQLRNALARLGIGTAQLITFLTYTVIILSLIALPAYLYIRYRRSQIAKQ